MKRQYRLTTYGQADPQTIKMQAQETSAALVNRQYEALLQHIYPKILENKGGKEAMMEVLKKTFEDLEKMGMQIDSFVIEEPIKQYVAGSEIHCLVPQTTFFKVPDGKMKVAGFMRKMVSLDYSNEYFVSRFLSHHTWDIKRNHACKKHSTPPSP